MKRLKPLTMKEKERLKKMKPYLQKRLMVLTLKNRDQCQQPAW
jgi:hypothetical protein